MKARNLLLLFLLLAIPLQAIPPMIQKSCTYDEPVYLVSGYSHLRTGDFRMKKDAPPLPGYLAAFPLHFLSLPLPLESPHWKEMKQYWDKDFKPFLHSNAEYSFARETLFKEGVNADKVLFLGRLPLVLITILLGLLVFFWARLLYGSPAGLLGLFLVAMSPNLIGNTWSIGCDLMISFTMCLACFAFLWYRQSPSLFRLALCGVYAGIAFASKFTGLLLGPIFFLYILVEALFHARSEGEYPGGSLLRFLFFSFSSLAAILLLAFLVASLFYGIPPKPRLYVEGVKAIYENVHPGFQWHFFGSFSPHARMIYYPVAFVLKTPIPILILILLTLVLIVRRKRVHREDLFLLIPIVMVLGVSLFDSANVGLRRILPIFPFLLILLAGTSAALLRYGLKGKLFLALMALVLLVEAALIFPNHLTYFNLIAGGPKNGHQYLASFDIDSGQDLKALARYMEKNKIPKVRLYYHGMAVPEYYQIPHEPFDPLQSPGKPPRGIYAMSINKLLEMKSMAHSSGMGVYDWLSQYSIYDWVGNTIVLFKIL